jgi:ElaB/YqjD/DUF883 family membrane-anchored ribosome-binding protein
MFHSTSSRDFRNDAADAGRHLADTASYEAHRLGDQARAWLDRQSTSAHDAALALRNQAGALGHHTQRYVRDEPVKSVLMAAALGALITGVAWMVSRHRL